MKASFIVKFVLGLLLVIFLIILCYKMVDTFTGLLTNAADGGRIEDDSGDYTYITPEPLPTMPEYMGEDSFYDNAQSSDLTD